MGHLPFSFLVPASIQLLIRKENKENPLLPNFWNAVPFVGRLELMTDGKGS